MGLDGSAHQITAYKRSMPRQRPATSKQTYETPAAFIAAVKARFGVKAFAWDLAAVATTNKSLKGAYYGPDNRYTARRDAFANNWTELRGDLWLNPPFNNIAPWAQKCAESAKPLADGGVRLEGKILTRKPLRRIFFLIPASVGANWWVQWVHEKAAVYFLNGRISFDGKGPHPKDTALVLYGENPGYFVWRWKDGNRTK